MTELSRIPAERKIVTMHDLNTISSKIGAPTKFLNEIQLISTLKGSLFRICCTKGPKNIKILKSKGSKNDWVNWNPIHLNTRYNGYYVIY